MSAPSNALAAIAALLLLAMGQGAFARPLCRSLLQGELGFLQRSPTRGLQQLVESRHALESWKGDSRLGRQSRGGAHSASTACQRLPCSPTTCLANLAGSAPPAYVIWLLLASAQTLLFCPALTSAAPAGLQAVDLSACPAVEAGSTAPPAGSREVWTAPSEALHAPYAL